jgi:integrase/recombinase XerD
MSKPKKHLPFAEWPEQDQRLWDVAFGEGDVFDEMPTAHLAPATKIGLRSAYARYLGFLAIEDRERLMLSANERISRDSIKEFAIHLGRTCRASSVAGTLRHLYQGLRYTCPENDWTWIKLVAGRIDTRAVARAYFPITSAQLFRLGVTLIGQSEADAVERGFISRESAQTYRDGLIIALLAAVPLRRRTLAALTIDRHLVAVGEHWMLDIPVADTKTNHALQFPLPLILSSSIAQYIKCIRPIYPNARAHRGLWPSFKGQPMTAGALYDAVQRRTRETLSVTVNLHRFRTAAGNLWSIHDPSNVRGVKDLLGHSRFDTTDKHYISSLSRAAGRELAQALKNSNGSL